MMSKKPSAGKISEAGVRSLDASSSAATYPRWPVWLHCGAELIIWPSNAAVADWRRPQIPAAAALWAKTKPTSRNPIGLV